MFDTPSTIQFPPGITIGIASVIASWMLVSSVIVGLQLNEVGGVAYVIAARDQARRCAAIMVVDRNGIRRREGDVDPRLQGEKKMVDPERFVACKNATLSFRLADVANDPLRALFGPRFIPHEKVPAFAGPLDRDFKIAFASDGPQ